MSRPFTLGVALDGAGWHPAAWREPSARPDELFTPDYWVDLVRTAEAGGIHYVTIEDSLALQSAQYNVPDERTDEVRGRLDALLIASRVAPLTRTIGLIPTVTTTYTEPFHVSKAVATLDHISDGRAGWQPKVSGRPDEAAHVGRRSVPSLEGGLHSPEVEAFIVDIFGDAGESVEVVRRLWDSWEDDAEIRDAATDRFLDADKVHTIDYVGERLSVRGPSITPRSPQGQPVVAALAHAAVPYRFAAGSADVVFVTPADLDHARRILDEVADAAAQVERVGEPLRVVADILVLLDGPDETAAARLERLDAAGRPLTSDTRIVAGSADEIADLVAQLAELGYDGVRLRPAVLTDDLARIGTDLVPLLAARGVLVPADDQAVALRARFGLEASVPSRYATPSLTGADR
ncbi:MAG: LLM class flavin-dependent oxidoreductase [Microbacterium ginsengisoli]|nr:FMNH2-dependent monooxygenase [Microbacterium sp. Leaf347]MBN9199148.1 LLM class flavin-dependent oxidoreductase [Microbacterium ginsengisoli]MCK9914838.1 LLM class flavin-dependent oxidoreductase [Microbacteriaceae bacterium K1510]OJU75056.1 MAG: FMNH2-dependent monooxygenase [Microbacterium sp. 71-23]